MWQKTAEVRLGDASRFEEIQKDLPLGRPAHVREVADLILFLASYRSGYTSGTIVTIDGGISSRGSVN
jgi:NAD(P)-dependent dehydrogenase (short-subunit alcohol dehydrogenase family)